MPRYATDLLRVGILMVLTGIMLYVADPANAVVFQAMGIGLFLVGTSHLTRRILFPQLNLQTIALGAVRDNNFAAAIVFAAIVYFLVKIMEIPLQVLK
jgi:hypothetical protein